MRSCLPRHLRQLTAISIMLLATTAVGTAGLPLGTSAACGCEAGEITVEGIVETEGEIEATMLAKNPFNGEAEVSKEPVAKPGKGAITSVGSCKKGNRVAKGGSCSYSQETPVGSVVGFRKV